MSTSNTTWARCVMVLGTTSGAGKGWLASALSRHYARQGLKVVPFKAQNISNYARAVASRVYSGLASLSQQLWASIAKEKAGDAGDALDRQVIEAAIKQTKEMGCFVAGTLVHTREGLRPIEKIQVGDYVLSKPESGEGETSYQRVTRTYEYDDRVVYFAALTVEDLVVPRAHPVDSRSLDRSYLVVTGAHPFWVKFATSIDLSLIHI